MVSTITEVVKEVVLSPRAEKFHTAVRARLSPRVKSLSGKAICVVDNHKPNAQPLMDSIAQALSRDYGPRKVTRFHKDIAASPLKDEVLKQIQTEYDVAVEGMGS